MHSQYNEYRYSSLLSAWLAQNDKSEHKIQSGKGSLHIEMDQVPKILKPLVSEWTREGFIVSFKVRFFFIFTQYAYGAESYLAFLPCAHP